MKTIRPLLFLTLALLVAQGCANLSEQKFGSSASPRQARDTQSGEIFHDYDYNSNGDVPLYPTRSHRR